jgi:hypothetical protein
MKKTVLLLLLASLCARPALAQKAPEGIWEGYDGEWLHVSQQLVALAEATPEEKFSWRPAPGVRSTSEVYMHLATANFYLLSVTGPENTRRPETGRGENGHVESRRDQLVETLAGSGEASAPRGNAEGPAAQGAHRGSRRHGGRDVPANHHSCE